MKTFSAAALCLALMVISAKSQSAATPANPNQTPASLTPAYSIAARDGNSCVCQRTVNQTNADGTVTPKTHSYVQLEAGMNHLVNGQWTPSSDAIDILPDGSAAATNGQYQAYFPANIYQGALDMVTSDGQDLQSRPALLCYVDGTNSVILADLQSSDGELVASNQVIYPDAFDGLNADLHYTYTKGTFEQDVILHQRPPPPASFGFNPATTRIEVLTEFFNAPQPELGNGAYDAANDLQDTTLAFGNARLVLGKAFSTTNVAQKVLEGATVYKSWLEFQGRTFLVEKLPYASIAPQMATLPLQSSVDRPTGSTLLARITPSSVPALPATRSVQACTNSILLAKTDYNQKPGVVLDYVALNAVVNNFTFQADTTYYVPTGGYFAIQVAAVFEGGTVIKFAPSTGGFQLIFASISCQSSPYRPIILTAQDDNTVGETISGSTGVPSGYYGNGITIESSGNVTLHDLRMSYINTGFLMVVNHSEFDNIQVVNCFNPIVHEFAGTTINNGLFYNIGGTAVIGLNGSTSVSGTQLTIDRCNTFADTNSSSLTLANCLLTASTNLLAGTGTLTTNNVANLAGNSGVYQTVGAGSHYLANGSPYRGAGTNNINATVLASLSARTTYPPLIYSNQVFSISTNLPPYAIRDTNSSPDLGYHYDPLDYIADQLTVTNATLTITNGIAIACYNRAGITLQGGASIYSIGTPLLPNWLVRYQSVQDQSVFLGGTNPFSAQNLIASPVGSTRPTGTIQFTHFSVPAAGGFNFNLNGGAFFNSLTVQHSELWGGTNDFSGTNAETVLLQNNLFFRSAITASNSVSTPSLAFTNNLIYGTTLSLVQPSGSAWYFFNNDVDGCTIATNSTLTNGYNAFINCSFSLTGTSNLVSTNAIGYQTGALGLFYQPTNSPLIDMGNITADKIALAHFTTQTNQAVETNTIVDIGYHYVALGTNGLPLVNSNGVPYYIADAQGGSTNQAPVITVQPTNFIAIVNGNAAFSVTAVGTPTLVYQWWFNVTNKLAGATSATLSLTNVQLTNAGNYAVVITNNYGAVTSSVAVLAVIVPVAITVQPTNFTVIQGSNATFNVTATGTGPLAYQWWFNTNNLLAGATSASLTITNAQATNAGYYSVVITNLANSVTSSNALLTVLLFPTVSITNPANNAAFSPGANINIGASAAGNNATIAQVQFFQGTSSLGTVTNAPYTLTWSNVPAGNYTLTVRATDSHGLVTASPGISINVGSTLPAGIQYWWKAETNALDSIGTNNGTLQGGVIYTNGEVGQAFNFDGSSGYVSTSIQITNPENFTIEGWFKTTTSSGGVLVGFAKGQTGTPTSYDRFIVMDNAGKVYFGINSGTGILLNTAGGYNDGNWHHVAATESTNTGTILYLDGAIAAANTSATNGENYAGWWRIGEDNLAGWAVAPASSYFKGAVDELSIYGRPLASNEIAAIYNAGSAGKGSTTFPVITTQPTNLTVMVGSNALFGVTVAGATPFNYQWYTTNSGALTGETNATQLLTNVQPLYANIYFVVVTNNYGSATSSVAVLTVLAPPTFAVQPTNLTVMAGSNATFSVVASGTAPLAYQWYGITNGLLAGATNASLTLTNVQFANNDMYYVTVTNFYGTISSTNALLTVLAAPVITSQPANQTVAQGGSAILSVTVIGTPPLSLQWYGVNAGILPGATNFSLLFPSAQTNNADTYYVTVTNYFGSVNSSFAILSVATPPTITITNPINDSVFFQSPTNITISATASDAAATISQVQFFQGTNSLGVFTNAPYTLIWSNVNAGDYALTAVAVDSGLTFTSTVVNVSVFSTNSLALWLKADAINGLTNNALVTTWPDSSGWTNNAWQTTSGQIPSYSNNVVNGEPAIWFNGSTYFNLPGILTSANSAETLVVLKAATTNSGALWRMGGEYPNPYEGFPNSFGHIVEDFGESLTSVDLGFPPQPLTQFNIYEITSQSNNWAAWLDGILMAQTNSMPFGSNPTPNLGANAGWGVNNFGGDIAEVIVFTRALNSSERVAVNNYLIIKYGLANSTPPAPTNLTATAISQTQVALTWEGVLTNGYTQISIERSTTASGPYAAVGQVGLANSYIDTNLSSGTQYWYRTRAINVTTNSAYSAQVSAVTFTSGANLPLGSLAMWLKADAGIIQTGTNLMVTYWADQSGNGNAAYQYVDSGAIPLLEQNVVGDRPAVFFNGINTYLNFNGSFLGALSGAEAFIVLNTATGTNGILWRMGDNGYGNGATAYPNSSGHIQELFGTTNLVNGYDLGVPPVPLTQINVYDISAATGIWEAWLNGIVMYQATNNTYGTYHVPQIGRDELWSAGNGTLWPYFKGDIAEIMIFNRPLTSAERATVNYYLNGKYLSTLLPPQGLAATPISPTQVRLAWSERVYATPTQISVERATNMAGPFAAVILTTNSQAYDTNLQAGTTYYYRARAFNAAFSVTNSAYSDIVQSATFTNGPTVPLPIALWLRADLGVITNSAGQVSQWNDQSANGNNAFQGALGSQPGLTTNANGSPVIYFNGTSSCLNLPNFMNTANGGVEALVVLKAATNYPSVNQPLWEMGGDLFDEKGYPNPSGSIVDDFGSARNHGPAPNQFLTQYHVYEVMSATNGWSYWINGSLQYQAPDNAMSFGMPMSLGSAGYEVALSGTIVFDYFAGDIAEILVFNRTLTISERLTLNEYLNGKYMLVPPVPATPTNLTATAISPTQIALTWDETLNGMATQIGIGRSISNGGFQLVAQVPAANSFVDTNLSPGTTYYYQVSAINLSQWSPTSNVAQATTPLTGGCVPFNSLALWLKADAGLLQGASNQAVNEWLDQSGNGNNASQPNSANTPTWVPGVIGDRPVVRFNGTSSCLNLPSFMNSATGAEAFVVLKVATNHPPVSQSLWEMGGDTWSTKGYPNPDGTVGDDFGSVGVHGIGIPAQDISQYHIYEVSAQPGSWNAWINGILQFQTTNNAMNFTLPMSLGVAGHEILLSGTFAYNYFAGDVAEIFVFNRGLTTDERTAVSAYLNGKYGLVPRTPATPTSLVAIALSPTQIALNWSETLNVGATRVSIERLNTNTWTYQAIAQVSDALSYVDTNVAAGTTYYYRVRAINVDQWSAYSGVAQATTSVAGGSLPFNALCMWFKADAGLWQNGSNSPVALWPDQSGNNHHASQWTPAGQPTWVAGTNGGYPSVWFDGTNDSLGIQNVLLNGAGAEAFAVLKSSTTNTFQSLWEFGGDAWNTKTYPNVDGSISDDFGSLIVYHLGVPAQPLNQYHIYEASSQNNDWAAWINGQLLYETPEPDFNTVSFGAGITLGGAPYASEANSPFFYITQSCFAGNMAEVLVFNRALTPAERVSVSSYLNQKYGLTPVVAITSPVNNAVFMGPTNITIAATAGDSAGIAQVQFFQGTASLGVDTNAPYSIVWSNAAQGSYALTAVATDNNGLSFTSAVVNITVAGITLTAPTNNAIFPAPTNVPVSAAVSDGNGISQVQFFKGTTLITTLTNVPYSFTWSNVTAGSYALTARATDSAGLVLTSSVVNVTLDSLPTVTLTNPVNNARFIAGSNIGLGASAADSDGTVAKVQFFQGTVSLGTLNSAPYTMVWSNVPPGAYSLVACATDNNGLTQTSSVVNIMVAGVAITSPTNYVVMTAPASVALSAAVTDNTNVTQVQYFQGATSLGTVTNAPYSLSWNSVAASDYVVTAKATDAGGLVFISPVVNVIVDTNPATTFQHGNSQSDALEYLQGRNPLVNGSVADTNGAVNLQIYTPLR